MAQLNGIMATSVVQTEHLLLTLLGTKHEEVTYSLNDKQTRARFAPVALIELLPPEERPTSVVALCTAQAKRESLPELEEDLPEKMQPRCVDVPEGITPEDLDEFLSKVAESIPNDPTVVITLDVTHGFRHFSFLTYVTVLYVSALRGIKIRGAYYGLLSRDHPSPILDLKRLLHFEEWVHALRVFEETGSTFPMAKLLEASGGDSQNARDIARDLREVSDAYGSALPLELGKAAAIFAEQKLKPLKRVLKEEQDLPLASEITCKLRKIFDRTKLEICDLSDGWKKRVSLTEEELRRQARLVDDLLERGNLAVALGLMREWTISWVIYNKNWHAESAWLDFHKTRSKAENLLGAIGALIDDENLRHRLSKEQCELGRFWNALRDLRNGFHHHGMRRAVLSRRENQFKNNCESVKGYWKKLEEFPSFSLDLGETTYRSLLVSPLGKMKGVLYSAVGACREIRGEGCDACIVVCSEQTEPLIAEALDRACYEGDDPIRLPFKDPYGGVEEIKALARKARQYLICAGEVLVNVTGGTTLMGLAVERIAAEARDLARPVYRFGLIDRRPPAEQDREPYRQAEVFPLDDGEERDDTDH